MDWAKTTARQAGNHLSLGICCTDIRCLTVLTVSVASSCSIHVSTARSLVHYNQGDTRTPLYFRRTVVQTYWPARSCLDCNYSSNNRRSHQPYNTLKTEKFWHIEAWTKCPIFSNAFVLTHWGRVTHICISNLIITGSDNGLSPGRHQAIIWTNAWILLIRTLGTNFSEILREIHKFSFKKMYLKMSSGKWRPFVLASMC